MLQVAECNVLESEHPKIDRAQLSECLAGCRRRRHHAQYVCTYRLPLLGCCSVGPAVAAFQPGDLQAVVDASLVQLFGVIGERCRTFLRLGAVLRQASSQWTNGAPLADGHNS